MVEGASRREFRRRVTRAYELAWQDRQDSGLDSVGVLERRLREANLPEEASAEGSQLRGILVDFWRRGVPPRRFQREVWKVIGRHTVDLLRVLRTVHDAWVDDLNEDDEAFAMPDGLRQLTEEFDGDWELLPIMLEPAAASEAVQLSHTPHNWHSAPVWSATTDTPGTATVHIGTSVIGRTDYPVDAWTRMRALEQTGLRADGSLDLRTHHDRVELGELLVAQPLEAGLARPLGDPHTYDTIGWANGDAHNDDRAWRELPEGRRTLSQVRHHYDLALRWFYPRLDEIALDIRFDDEASDLAESGRWGGAGNRRGWGERYCWLWPEANPHRAQVMVWSRRIGWTDVSPRVWEELKRLERGSVFADGRLFMQNPPDTGTELLVLLPRVR